jgi:hypothetical protein
MEEHMNRVTIDRRAFMAGAAAAAACPGGVANAQTLAKVRYLTPFG